MSNDTIKVNINGVMTDVENVDVISYERLCKLAVQPKEYRPKITYSTGPHFTRELLPGEEAPLTRNTVFNVWITGAF